MTIKNVAYIQIVDLLQDRMNYVKNGLTQWKICMVSVESSCKEFRPSQHVRRGAGGTCHVWLLTIGPASVSAGYLLGL